jgi:hypothetical protein
MTRQRNTKHNTKFHSAQQRVGQCVRGGGGGVIIVMCVCVEVCAVSIYAPADTPLIRSVLKFTPPPPFSVVAAFSKFRSLFSLARNNDADTSPRLGQRYGIRN